jgi:uncharacterized membrane protein YjjP (DUF1212 family)
MVQVLEDSEVKYSQELSKILLEVGTLLMASGTNTLRIRITISRIAKAFGFSTDVVNASGIGKRN